MTAPAPETTPAPTPAPHKILVKITFSPFQQLSENVF